MGWLPPPGTLSQDPSRKTCLLQACRLVFSHLVTGHDMIARLPRPSENGKKAAGEPGIPATRTLNYYMPSPDQERTSVPSSKSRFFFILELIGRSNSFVISKTIHGYTCNIFAWLYLSAFYFKCRFVGFLHS